MGIVKSDKCKETLINQILKEKQALIEEQIAYEQLLCMTVDARSVRAGIDMYRDISGTRKNHPGLSIIKWDNEIN